MRDNEPPGTRDGPGTSGGLSAGQFAGVGIQFAASLVLFLLAGQWVDRKFGTSPVFVLVGVFVGGGAAFYNTYRRLVAAQKEDDERRRSTK